MEEDLIKIKCFIAMPFSSDFDRTLASLRSAISSMNSDSENISVILERADITTKGVFIYENLARHIDECDVAIIDLTNENNNVIFEFGYAFAKGKHIIPITQDESKSIAADYRSFVYIQYDKDELTTFEFRFKLRLQELIDSIRQSRKTALLEEQVTIQKSEFEVSCFTNRKVANLQKKFENAKEHIRIIQTNLDTVVKDYAESIENAMKASPFLEVRLLTLDPESYFAAVRASQLGVDVSEFRFELHKSLYDLQDRFKNAKNFEIRIYDDFPTQICFTIDNFIYNCVVSKYQPSRNNCVFELPARYPSLNTSFNLHFTSVWRDAKTTKRYDPLKSRYSVTGVDEFGNERDSRKNGSKEDKFIAVDPETHLNKSITPYY
jgi:nucleoside 2-deoxyribosyltransferase